MLLKPSVLTSQCPMRSQAAHTARAALLVRATKSQVLKAYCSFQIEDLNQPLVFFSNIVFVKRGFSYYE